MTGIDVPPVIDDSNMLLAEDEGPAAALRAFIRAVTAVASARDREVGRPFADVLTRVREVALALAASPESLSALDAEEAMPQRAVLDVLEREMWWYAWHYRSADPTRPPAVPASLQQRFGPRRGDPQREQAVEDAETIIGSVDKLLDQLPGPLKKALHAVLEILRLTHGIA